ncbi:hypothetical protein POTOM_005324 [Populus tomentosa]|uniref:MYB-CC type transcription factor LHEQLE-containing domain-containing protein n=1 Tax=Populus tomentosa TaxID=118781 RepID=A0A8X8DDV2_POPTO|nr:hypothetical protein POTOM_005324 [Populus tomentosa]
MLIFRGIHIAKALQLQRDVQRRMHEQMKVCIQRNLRSQIEEQGRQLKQMLDHQLKTGNTNPASIRNN